MINLWGVRHRHGGDGGYDAVQLAVLVPLFGLLIMALVAAGRIGTAREQVQQAAREAARAASLAPTPTAANLAARAAAGRSLAGSSTCPTWTLTLNTAGLTVPVGQPGVVSATLVCQVSLHNLAVLPLPAHLAMASTFTAPVDTFGNRQ